MTNAPSSYKHHPWPLHPSKTDTALLGYRAMEQGKPHTPYYVSVINLSVLNTDYRH